MAILYFFQSIRNGFLDTVFQTVTFLGEETVFMAVGMIFFWCVDKYRGYYLLTTGFVGTIVNQFLKMLCRVPRPWVLDPKFEIVESAREAATGYSFPSGHTQSAVSLFGGIARSSRNRAIQIISVIACLLVPVSRMYLGVHTPLDVGVSFVIALALIFVAYPLFMRAKDSPRTMYAILSAVFLISVAFLLFVELYRFPVDTDAENLLSARKNAYTLFGCMVGLLITYTVDLKLIHFPTEAVWWAQIIKAIGGLALVILVKEVTKAPLNFVFDGGLIARSVRYLLMVIVGGVLWPITFKAFSKLGRPKQEQIN